MIGFLRDQDNDRGKQREMIDNKRRKKGLRQMCYKKSAVKFSKMMVYGQIAAFYFAAYHCSYALRLLGSIPFGQ